MKKMIKKTIATVLCVIMMLGVAPLNGFVGLELPELHLPDFGSIFETKASAVETNGTCGDDLTWVYDETTLTLTITGTGDMYDYLRRNYDGIYMTTAPWKPYYNTMKNVVIESGATSISDHAFDGCTGITSITIPDTVTNIGEYAFAKCKGLTSIAIPNSVINIGESIFSYSGLESVTIGTSVTSLSNDAFRDCTELTSITIPDSVTSIGKCAFSGCTGLTDVTIGNGVTSIGEHAFAGCTGLTTITIPGSVTSIYSYAFYGCTDLTSVTIGNGVKSIEQHAFDSCSGLTSITIPAGVTSIGEMAFKNCTRLINITIPESVTSIAGYAFSGCTGLKTAGPIGGGYNCEFGWTDSIPAYAFYGCSELKSVNVPTGITKIGAAAFCESGLTGVKIPESVNKIGSGAFAFCYALKAIEYNAANCTLEPYYSYIDNPFFFCFTESIVVGKNVVSVPAYMFGGTITMDYHKLDVTTSSHNTSIDSACFTARCDDFGDPDDFINGADQSFLGDSEYLREKYGIDSSNYQKITYAEANIIKDNHTFDNGVVIKEATCKDDGEIKYTCTECGYTYTETIPKTDDHDWNIFTITPDCTQDGGDLYVCRSCGHSKLENAVPALGHSFTNYKYNNDATTEKDGTETAKCDRCDATDTRTAVGTRIIPNVYILTYDANGGTGAPARQNGNGNVTLSSTRPTKDGYNFLGWAESASAASAKYQPGETFNITKDITLYAVWQKKEEPTDPSNPDNPENPTANARINVAGETTLGYRTKVTIIATASNLDSAYHLVLVINGKEYHGNNVEVSSDTFELKSDVNYYVKIVDSNNRIQKDASGNELKKDGGTIKCNAGFIQKIIAFFQGLFGLLPNFEIKP